VCGTVKLDIKHTMDSKKVRRMVVLHCNGKTYGNAYLITFNIGALPTHARARTHAHTHTLAPSILPLLEAPAEGFFWNLPEFGRLIRFDALHGCETWPHETHFTVRNSQKSLRAMMAGIAAQQAMCGSVRHRDSEATVPACLLSRRFLCKTCT
jgi:hypothetical protein